MTAERRNDIGSKVLIGVVSILVGMLVSRSMADSSQALCKAQYCEVEIKGIKVSDIARKESIADLKGDVKDIKKDVQDVKEFLFKEKSG